MSLQRIGSRWCKNHVESRVITVLPAVFLVSVFCRYQIYLAVGMYIFPVGITNLAGTPCFRKRGAGCIKKGAIAPFLREIGFPAKKIIPKCTDRDFLRYRYGKYQEIPTGTDRKIPIRYTTLVELDLYVFVLVHFFSFRMNLLSVQKH